jgi:trigger factor
VEIRKDLEGNLQKSSEEIFADAVLNEVIQISHIKYPAAFLENYLDMIMEDFDDNLRRQYGIDLDTYCSITGQTKETLREKRRTQTEHDVRLILVIDKLAQVEELEVDVEQMNAVIAKEINNFEASLANLLEQVYSNPDTRQRVARQIVTDRVKQRLIDIAKGIEVPIGLDEKMLVEINMNTTSAGAENESTEGETAPASSETPDASAEAGVETEQN